ncbi:HAD-superfamily hydrolase [Acaromyces ingoldii]|uniref:HAD-superfamily hydrolase n=1 Tax=Acaromyces ingoldii TaxID=215250 RepID=A0A316YMP6_9BASI|nr:HAD-superfamily hydrolase [Acaromyces ingoldii]PWN89938.1 HAD-superfamily hydrolase [Acaromyces ingoldii]
MLQYKKRDLSKKVALALDIDGVLKHGDTVLPGAKDAIRRLVEKRVPFILLTNGGGVSEEDRAKKLSKQLEAVISPKSLILGRTPMKALAQKHADDPILVTGTNGGHSKILKDYGFQKVYTVAEVQQWNERIFPFSKLRKEQCTNSLSINGEDIVFKAFFFLQESDDWGRDMQYAIDVMSPPYGSIVAGKPKAGSAEEPLHEKDRPKLYYASADLLTPTEGISRPRLGMGAIKLSLESIYDKLFYPSTGQRLEEMTVTYGKPSKMTYEYASQVFEREHGVKKDEYTIWMIGDNPDVDIKGANRAGWKSALVKTGVYQKNEMPTEEPTLFVDNVLEAVDKILALHSVA